MMMMAVKRKRKKREGLEEKEGKLKAKMDKNP